MVGLSAFKDGAWYEPSNDQKVALMLDLLDLKPGDCAVDLGSGDGKIVIEMAKRGVLAVGIEKDFRLVEESRESIKKEHLEHVAQIIHGSFWDINLSNFSKVYLYQFKTVMQRLEEKLGLELPSQALVVSNYWKFPTWKPEKKIEDVYLYKNV